MVKVLLAWKGEGDLEGYKVDPTDVRNYAVRKASENGHLAVVEVLLAWKGLKGKRVDPTAEDNEAVLLASREGHSAVVKVLLAWKGEGDLEGREVEKPSLFSGRP